MTLAGNARAWPRDFAERLLHALPGLGACARLSTATFLTLLGSDLTLPEEDAIVRAGAAGTRTAKLSETLRHREARHLLTDPDLLVRACAAKHLYDAAPDDLEVLEEALTHPPLQWTCMQCDSVIPGAVEQCPDGHRRPTPRLS